MFLELSCTHSSVLMMWAQKERLLHRAADREKSPSVVLLLANPQQHQTLFSWFCMMVAESFLISCLVTASKKHPASQYTQQHLEQLSLSEQHPFITMLHFHLCLKASNPLLPYLGPDHLWVQTPDK